MRSYGTSSMLLIADFQRFFIFFRIFFTPQKYISLQFFLRTFFSIKQDTFLILKLLITFLKELVVGQGSFLAKCTGLFGYMYTLSKSQMLLNFDCKSSKMRPQSTCKIFKSQKLTSCKTHK